MQSGTPTAHGAQEIIIINIIINVIILSRK